MQTTEPQAEVMGLEDLADKLGISLSHAYHLARQDALPLPTIKVGRRYYFSKPLYKALMVGRYKRETPENTDGR